MAGRGTFLIGAVALVGCCALSLVACDSNAVASGTLDECTFGADETCPQDEGFAQICVSGDFFEECVNVCRDATNLGPPNGNEGDFCEMDAQCGAGLACDNDALGGLSSCTCVFDPNGDCPVVDVAAGSVDFGGDCDSDTDCAEGMPCIDCVCL